MKVYMYALPLVVALALSGSVRADDAATPGNRAAAGDAKAKDGHGHVGVLGDKPAGAKEGVVAVLVTKHKGESKTYNLIASGDIATQIADYQKKGVKVKVTGEDSGDDIKVASIGDAPVHKKKTN